MLLIVVVLFLSGCGKEEAPKSHPVAGQIFYDGAPAAGVKVFFMPTSAPMIPSIPQNPSGVTDEAGKFTLSTFSKDDGAPEGGYQVVLLWLKDSKEEQEEDLLLGWYTAVHSKLTAEVRAGSNTLQAFKLPKKTSPPEAVAGVPGRN
jgi:hypothetical protein